MDETLRKSFARDGFVVLRSCVPQDLLRGLATILEGHVRAWEKGQPAASGGGKDDWHAGFTKDPITGQWQRDDKPLPRSHHTDDTRQAAGDGQRWAPEAGLPLDPHWGGPYRQLLTLPLLRGVLSEILGDVAWGHTSPAVPEELRPRYRLDHDYVDFKPPHDPELHGPARIPVPNPPGLHGSTSSYHVTAVFELRDIPAADGGFGALVGSHKTSYELPTHEGWRLPPWPANVPVQGVDMKAGDVLVFTEKLSHTTVPYTGSTGRATVFYKFVPHGLHHADKVYRWWEHHDLDEDETSILSLPPHWYNKVTADGRVPCAPEENALRFARL